MVAFVRNCYLEDLEKLLLVQLFRLAVHCLLCCLILGAAPEDEFASGLAVGQAVDLDFVHKQKPS